MAQPCCQAIIKLRHNFQMIFDQQNAGSILQAILYDFESNFICITKEFRRAFNDFAVQKCFGIKNDANPLLSFVRFHHTTNWFQVKSLDHILLLLVK